MSEWVVEYDNDTSPMDEGFWEWWTVTNGVDAFKADSAEAAQWLCDLLNAGRHSRIAGKAGRE